MISIDVDRILSPGRSARLVALGLAMVAMVSFGFDAVPRRPETGPRLGEDMVLALPVPTGALVLDRRIDHASRRSLLVVDLDPSNPPSFDDTAVFLRLEPIPGVLLARSTRVDWEPGPDRETDWWTFPHHHEVKVSSHPTMLEAASAFRAQQGSGNRSAGVGASRIMQAFGDRERNESGGTTRVGPGIDR